MDDRGRRADQTIFHILGWRPGTPIDIKVDAGIVVVSAEPDSADRLPAPGYLRLPAAIRHQLSLRPGNQARPSGGSPSPRG